MKKLTNLLLLFILIIVVGCGKNKGDNSISENLLETQSNSNELNQRLTNLEIENSEDTDTILE